MHIWSINGGGGRRQAAPLPGDVAGMCSPSTAKARAAFRRMWNSTFVSQDDLRVFSGRSWIALKPAVLEWLRRERTYGKVFDLREGV